MYPYTATATGFDVAMPGWVQEGGIDKWVERLKDPATRARVIAEMRAPADGSPGSVAASGSPDNILILGGKTPGVEALAGRTLGDIPKSRGTRPRSEEHTSELQSLMRRSYAVFCLKQKKAD